MVTPFAPGDRILDYIILEHVGSGGFGDVYRAEHAVLHRTVALKIPRHDELVRALAREGALHQKLEHRAIVPIVEAHVSHEPPFLAFEYIPGPSLRQLIDREGRLEPSRAFELAAGLRDALAHAHAHEVVHGDVKPANILLEGSGLARRDVRLSDFGLARLPTGDGEGASVISQSLALRDSTERAAAGTLRYIAPEILEGRSPDASCDVYAFGVLLFEMLTGRTPVGHETPRSVRPTLPAAVDDLFLACYAPRARRCADAGELEAPLERARRAWDAQTRSRRRVKERAAPETRLGHSAARSAGPGEREATETAAVAGRLPFDAWRESLLERVRRRLLAVDPSHLTAIDPCGFDLGVSRPPGGSRHHVLVAVVDRLDADEAKKLLRKADRIWERRKGLWECEVSFCVVAREVVNEEGVLWSMRGFTQGWWRRRRTVLVNVARGKTHARELGSSLRESPLRKQVVGTVTDAVAELTREERGEPARKRRGRGRLFPLALAAFATFAIAAVGIFGFGLALCLSDVRRHRMEQRMERRMERSERIRVEREAHRLGLRPIELPLEEPEAAPPPRLETRPREAPSPDSVGPY